MLISHPTKVGYRDSGTSYKQAGVMKNNASYSIIEGLETRIAPAAIFTFTDADGDLVTVETSKGTNTELNAAISSMASAHKFGKLISA